MKLRALRVLFTPMGRTGTKRPSGNCARGPQSPTTGLPTDRGGCLQSRALVVVTGECSASSLLILPQRSVERAPFNHLTPCARGKLQGSSSAVDRPNACPTPSCSSLAPQPPAGKHFHGSVVRERHVTQSLAYRPSGAKRSLHFTPCPFCHFPTSPLIAPLSSDGGPPLTRMRQGLHP
jgi:hypothetical protein